MKRILLSLFALVTVTGLSGCGSIDKETAQVLKEINSGYENEGREVTLTGYLGVPRNIVTLGNNVNINLYKIAGQNDDKHFARLEVPFGQGRNSYYVPKKYHGSDVEIYDNEGNMHGYLTKVNVTGIVRYTNKNWEEYVNEEIIKGHFDNDFSYENKIEKQKQAKAEAEKRRKATGDPNDYSFKLIATTITVD